MLDRKQPGYMPLASYSYLLRGFIVFFIRYGLEPVDGSSLTYIRINGNMGELTGRACAMPVSYPRRNRNGISFPDDLNRFALFLIIADSFGNHQELPVGMGMPKGSGFGFKRNTTDDTICFGIRSN